MRVFVMQRMEPEGRDTPWLLFLLVRLAINAAALWVASAVISGIDIAGWQALVATAAIFGIVNALVKPVAQIIGLPLTCLTMGLFILVINAGMLALTAWIAGFFDLAVHIDGFWSALLGALLISIVSALLTAVIGPAAKGKK